MPDVTLIFHVHVARPLHRRRIQDAGTTRPLFDEAGARTNLERLSRVCLDPAFDRLTDLTRGGLRIGLAVSGPAIEQLVTHAPHTLERLQRLAAEGNVDLVGQTYQQSLAELGDIEEFIAQIEQHRRAISHYFGREVQPVFRGTGLHLSPTQVPLLRRLGFTSALIRLNHGAAFRVNSRPTLGADPQFRFLPRNDRLSDDLAVRFSDRSWDRWPLTADRFAAWIAASPGRTVNLDLDIRVFGEVNPADSGVFDFMLHLPDALSRHGVQAVAPSEDIASQAPTDRAATTSPPVLGDPEIAGIRFDDRLRRSAMRRLYALRPHVLDRGGNAAVEWSRLTSADYLRPLAPGERDVHPFRSRFDAFMSLMHSLDEIEAAASPRRWVTHRVTPLVESHPIPEAREALPVPYVDPDAGAMRREASAGNPVGAGRH